MGGTCKNQGAKKSEAKIRGKGLTDFGLYPKSNGKI